MLSRITITAITCDLSLTCKGGHQLGCHGIRPDRGDAQADVLELGGHHMVQELWELGVLRSHGIMPRYSAARCTFRFCLLGRLIGWEREDLSRLTCVTLAPSSPILLVTSNPFEILGIREFWTSRSRRQTRKCQEKEDEGTTWLTSSRTCRSAVLNGRLR